MVPGRRCRSRHSVSPVFDRWQQYLSDFQSLPFISSFLVCAISTKPYRLLLLQPLPPAGSPRAHRTSVPVLTLCADCSLVVLITNRQASSNPLRRLDGWACPPRQGFHHHRLRSEEHTSEL